MGLLSIAKSISSAQGLILSEPNQPIEYWSDSSLSKSQTWRLIDDQLGGLETVPRDGDYYSFVKTYATMPWIYIAAWVIASSIASRRLIIEEGKEGDKKEVEIGDVYELFNIPNYFDDISSMIELLFLNLELTGNGYWEKFGMVSNLPSALYNIEPYNIDIIPDPKKKVKAYRYWLQSRTDKIDYEPEQIAHFKYVNPLSQFYGQGTVKALQVTLVTELNREAYVKGFLENEARPDVIIKHNADATKGIRPLTKEDREELAVKWKESFQGPRKVRRPVVLQSGMDVSLLTNQEPEMAYREMEKSNRERVLGAAGVPPAKVGLFEYANYANMVEQLKLFWHGTLPPKCKVVASAIDKFILKPFDKNLSCRFDWEDIPELRATEKEMTDVLNSQFDRGLLSREEYRTKLGRNEIDEKEHFFITSSYVPFEDMTTPTSSESETPTLPTSESIIPGEET